MPIPKRIRSTRSSRAVNEASTRVVVSRKIGLDRRVDRQDGVLVLDEIAEMGVLFVADWRFERDRLLGDLEDFAHFLKRHGKLFRELLGRWLAANLMQHLARGPHDLVDRLDHMHRNADRAGLIGDRAGDRLP